MLVMHTRSGTNATKDEYEMMSVGHHQQQWPMLIGTNATKDKYEMMSVGHQQHQWPVLIED